MSQSIVLLRLIASSDGQLGWYQLDRAVSMRGIVGMHIPSELARLVSAGLVTCDGDPKAAASRYRITDAGRSVLQNTLQED